MSGANGDLDYRKGSVDCFFGCSARDGVEQAFPPFCVGCQSVSEGEADSVVAGIGDDGAEPRLSCSTFPLLLELGNVGWTFTIWLFGVYLSVEWPNYVEQSASGVGVM